jgi:hypothetical protein
MVYNCRTSEVHRQDAGHFRCTCGEHLRFGNEVGSMTPLVNQRREQNQKIGECPKCGRIHVVPLPAATRGTAQS